MEYYSAIKENEIMPSAVTGMDLEIIILSEVSQRQNIIWYQLHVESWAGGRKATYMQNRNRPTDTENKLMITEGERWEGGGKLKFGD